MRSLTDGEPTGAHDALVPARAAAPLNGRDPAWDGPVDEVRFLDVAAVVLRRWRLVAAITAATVLIALAVALLRPRLYTARTVLLPPPSQGDGRAALIASQLGDLPGLGALGGSSNARLINVIARSRSLADTLVATLKPPADTAAVIRTMLARRTRVEENSDGAVVVEVSGRDPRLAARVANAFPPLINAFSAKVSTESAQRKQEFLETQIRGASERLARSEAALLRFQKGQNAPEIGEQARRTIDAASDLQRQISEQEVRVAQLRRSATADNPALRAAEAELGTRRAQLRRLTGSGGGSPLFVPLGQSADLKAEVTRLTREYTRDEQVYVSLTGALAQAQIDANNNLPVVSVLDPALPPDRPSGFGVKVIGAVALVLGAVLGLLAAFVAEHLRRARHDPEGQRFFVAWDEFRGTVPGARARKTGAAG